MAQGDNSLSNNSTSWGLSLFNKMDSVSKSVMLFITGQPPRRTVGSTNTTSSSQQTESLDDEKMEQVLPLEAWKEMDMHHRHFFLDKFYPVRRKYLYEREGRELCAFEELELFKCTKSSSNLESLFKIHDNWSNRIDPCHDCRHEFERCVTVMTVYQPLYYSASDIP
jgi:hypothetical protein